MLRHRTTQYLTTSYRRMRSIASLEIRSSSARSISILRTVMNRVAPLLHAVPVFESAYISPMISLFYRLRRIYPVAVVLQASAVGLPMHSLHPRRALCWRTRLQTPPFRRLDKLSTRLELSPQVGCEITRLCRIAFGANKLF